MEKITKTQESNVIAYATHDIMYMNDMLCNITKSLRDDVKKRDKEANKIYGAIHKRVKKHLDEQMRVFSVHIGYFADFCAHMDDFCEPKYITLVKAIERRLKAENVSDSSYLAKVEALRVFADFVKVSTEDIVKSARSVTPKAYALDVFTLHDIARIANNFMLWEFRKVEKAKYDCLDTDADIIDAYKEMCETIIDYGIFVKSSNAAVKENYEEEKENVGKNE